MNILRGSILMFIKVVISNSIIKLGTNNVLLNYIYTYIILIFTFHFFLKGKYVSIKIYIPKKVRYKSFTIHPKIL